MQLTLIAMAGLPGVGKSTVANKIASELHVPVFSVDPIESAIVRSGISQCFETGLAAYLVAETLAREQLKLGMSVVVDAVNPIEISRAMWRNLASETSSQLKFIECVCPDESIHKLRVENRRRDIPGFEILEWRTVEVRRLEYETWKDERLVLNTTRESPDWEAVSRYLAH